MVRYWTALRPDQQVFFASDKEREREREQQQQQQQQQISQPEEKHERTEVWLSQRTTYPEMRENRRNKGRKEGRREGTLQNLAGDVPAIYSASQQ
jgi:flagellar biosynthesis/type III secretory pathway protein FliH